MVVLDDPRIAVGNQHVALGELINKLLVIWRLGNPLNRKRTLTTRRQEESFSLDADVVNPIKVVMLGGETRAPGRNITKKLDLRDDSRPHNQCVMPARVRQIDRKFDLRAGGLAVGDPKGEARSAQLSRRERHKINGLRDEQPRAAA